MLELPDGHRLVALEASSSGYIPGLSLTITSDDDASGPKLPRFHNRDPLIVMDMATYRKWGADPDPFPVRKARLTTADEPVVRHVPRREIDARTSVYTPAKPPVLKPHPAHPQGGDIKLTVPPPDTRDDWPTFPGQGLPITGEPVQGDDPGDEHMGGPR
jgi:hypothetical protein